MAHKSHRKHLKHVHAHEQAEAPHLHPADYSLRDMAGEVVHRAVDAVKAAPHAIVERVLRKPRKLIEKLSGTYAKSSAK